MGFIDPDKAVPKLWKQLQMPKYKRKFVKNSNELYTERINKEFHLSKIRKITKSLR